MLVHDPQQRPSAVELLYSTDMPPLELEDLEFCKTIANVLLEKRMKYWHLMEACFNQKTREISFINWVSNSREEFHYSDSEKAVLPPSIRYQQLVEKFIRRCQETGAQYFQV